MCVRMARKVRGGQTTAGRRRARYGLVGLWFGVLAVGLVFAAASSGQALLPARQIDARFQRIGTYAPLAAGRYAFFFSQTGAFEGTQHDDLTGHTAVVPTPADCSQSVSPALGADSLVVVCEGSGTLARYALPAGPWVRFPAPVNCTARHDFAAACTPVAVGTQWVQITESCFKCATTTVVENLRTHQERPPVTGAHVTTDLNRRFPVRHLCAPVDTAGVAVYPVGAQVILVRGRTAYLQRCGQAKTEKLGSDIYDISVLSRFAIWGFGDKLHGIQLPSDAPFVERLPKGLSSVRPLVVDDGATYIQAEVSGVPHAWRGRNPSH
jgi:hypothetical protein